MLTVVIKNDGEPRVTQLTYQNLWRELKEIPDAELIVSDDWFNVLPKIKNKYICFVEADCLVNSGYFSSQLGLFKKNPDFRRLAMLSSAVGVNNWATKFYGYGIEKMWSDGDEVKINLPHVQPVKEKRSKRVYPVQIGYVPGAVINAAMLREVLPQVDIQYQDLIYLSTQISLGFWQQGDGHRVHINPNTTYVTTEEYVNDLGEFDPGVTDQTMNLFRRESI